MRFNSKIGLGFILFLLSSFGFVQSVSADGMIHIHIDDPDMRGWRLHREDQQLCAINYEDGFENMILSIEVSDFHGEKAVWIFPVPAKPDRTVIDIIKGFPTLWGYNVKEKLDEVISGAFNIMRLSQLYPLPFMFINYFLGGIGMYGGTFTGRDDVEVHDHIEEMGLTTELITAKDGGAFHHYLTSKGLDLPADSKSVLDEYIGQEYCFVVSWISDLESFRQETDMTGYRRIINTVSVFVTFPTDTIYFPLKPTSVYGSTRIPMLIYVMGHVTPELYPEIKRESQVDYFVKESYNVPHEFSHFFNGKTKIKDLKYTKIKIDTPSKYLTEDLWIKNSAPVDVVLADYLSRYVWIWAAIFFVLSSCLASMLAGTIIFRKEKQPTKFALLGVWNLLTIIGFAVAIDRSIKLNPEPKQEPRSGGIVVSDHRKILYIFSFSIFFLIINFVFQIVLQSIF